MRQLSGTDTSMLYSDRPHAQNLIAPFGLYDPSTAPGGRVTFDDVLAFVQSRLHISTSFRERLVRVPLGLDRPYWVLDPDFDLEYHVRQLALPAPGGWRQFCTQVARVCQRPLDLDRPPWEMYIIEGLDGIEGVPRGSFAMVLKLHHAAVDGVAGAEIITALHDKTPESATGIESSDDTWSPERMPTDLELMARAGRNAVTRPLAFLRTVAPAVRHLPSTLRGGGMGGAVTATRFNRDVSPHRVFGEVHFELAALKKIKTALDGPSTPPAVSGSPGLKINDVGLALVGGGLRRYLEDNDELPNESLIALMPISVRPTQTQRPQGLEVDAAAGGNRFAMMPIPMATDVDDPIERLRRIRQATAAAKNVSPTSARALVEMSELLPGALTGSVQRAVVRAANRAGRALGVHTIVTNVPGPQVPVYFCGARATRISGMAPIVDGMGLIHGIGSYDGDVPVCFTADREMMPDPEFYEDCLRDSYDELAASTTRFP